MSFPGTGRPWHRHAAHLPFQHNWCRHTEISFTAPMNISETFLTWLDMFCKVREGPIWMLKLLPSAKTARHRSGEEHDHTAEWAAHLAGQEVHNFQSLLLGLSLSFSLYHSL